MKKLIFATSVALSTLAAVAPAYGQRMQQPLGRGVVAVYGHSNGSNAVEITWRRLVQDGENATYNIYVATSGDNYVKLNDNPLSNTNFATTPDRVPYGSAVAVSLIKDGVEGDRSTPFSFNDMGLRNIYMEISYAASPLDMTKYTTKFVWPCDLDGNGEYDYVVDRCPVDGSLNYFVEGYKADGTHLWTIDLGPNEKPCDGQNDNMCAYDIDCDGYGELIVQTSDGTRFWDAQAKTWGKYLLAKETGDSDGDGIIDYNNQTTKNPPRYMTVVDGLTGAEKASCEFEYDDAYNRTNKAQLMGDEYNKHEAHVGIFYHDGIHPAICGEWTSRYTNKDHHFRNCAFAYDFDSDGKAHNWHQLFNENVGGSVFHMIRIFDADGDGRDEMSSGAYVMDHDGSTLYDTGISHGDRHRTTDIDPERPGMETFSIQQNAPDMLGMILFDARTGEAVRKWYLPTVGDVGRGEAIDIDPTHPGLELFSTMDDYQVFDAKGEIIPGLKGYFPTEGIWWDGQLDRENVNSPDGSGYNAMIVDFKNGRLIEMAKESDWTILSSNAKRGKFWGDIIGDWREELVLIREIGGVCQGIVGFTTDYKTNVNNIYCLQQDPHYRADCTTRGYYQTPNTSFFLGYDMPRPPLPPCLVADATTDVFGIASGNSAISPRTGVKDVYVMPVINQTLTLASATDATVWKGLEGTLTLSGNHANRFVVVEGTLDINGALTGEVDLRARGTVSGTGTLSKIVLEGALNHMGGRIKPTGTITYADSLCICAKTFIEIGNPGTDRFVVKGHLSATAPLVFAIYNAPEQNEYVLLTCDSCDSSLADKISTYGLSTTPHHLEVRDNSVVLIVDGKRQAADGVVWTGAISSDWDYQTNNFAISGQPTTFISGDGVVFDDSALSTTVNITEAMSVSTATFCANNKEYTLTGGGAIDGATIFHSGDITVSNLNYNMQLDRATLTINNNNAVCDNNVVVSDTATLVINSGSTAIKGQISGDGTLVKTGRGQLTLNYNGANSWASTILNQGTIAMGTWRSTVGKSNSIIRVTGNSAFTVFDNNSQSETPTVSNVFIIDEGVILSMHAGHRCNIRGALKGKGTYLIDFPYVRGDVYTNLSDFEGIYRVNSDNCRFVQSVKMPNGTLRLDQKGVVSSMSPGSGNTQNLTHQIGTLTGPGTLGYGTWNVSCLLYADGPTTVTGALVLNSAVLDLSNLIKGKVTESSQYQLLKISGTVTIGGTTTIIPAVPAEGYSWDLSTLTTDGIVRVKAEADGIESVHIDDLGNRMVYDLAGRRVLAPTTGIYIIDGRKVRLIE